MAQIESTELTAPTHRSAEERAAAGKRPARRSPRRRHASGRPPPGAPTRSSCSRSRPPPACPSSSRSATGACSSRRSRSTAAPPRSWRPTSPATPTSGSQSQLCGDAHLSNFGGFASPERRLVFDINDFDETLPGPWEWDVKRLAASFEVAGRDRASTPSSAADRRPGRGRAPTARRCASSPRCATSTSGTRGSTSTTSRSRLQAPRGREAAQAVRDERRQGADARTACGRSRKLTTIVDGEPRIVSDPPLIVPLDDLIAAGRSATGVERACSERSCSATATRCPTTAGSCSSGYRYVDMARKVVGVGSVGTRAWIVLLLGPRRRRSAVPAGQGGAAVGARAVRSGRAALREPRPARGRGPAADAGGERHLPRLGRVAGPRRRGRATSTCASCGTGRSPPTSSS